MYDNLKITLSDLSSSNKIKPFITKDNNVINESSIWKSFKNKDESAFIYIYDTYYEVLLNLGIQFTRDKDLIKDCIQDLFIDIRIRRNTLANVKSIKAYLMVCFRRKLLNYIALEDSRTNKTLEIARETFEVDISPEDTIIEKQFDKYQLDKLKKNINQLTPKEREAIYYFYYENLSYSEITELFNYSQVKTTRNLIYQALDKLRSFMLIILFLILLITI